MLEPALLHGTGAVYGAMDRNFTGERIIMPLAADGVHGDGIIGATFYRSTAGNDEGAERVEFFALDDPPPAMDAEATSTSA